MSNGDSTANVGDHQEIESQGHPTLRLTGEIDLLEIGDVSTYGDRGWHFRNSEFSEVIELDKTT